MRRAAVLTLLCFVVCLLPVALKRWTCGFKLSKMRLDMPFREDWEITKRLSDEEIASILAQPFTYLDRGAQCYVFASQDQKYVIKLFRYDAALFGKRKGKTFYEKVEHMFNASLLAYQLAPIETGLLYLHLNLTDTKLPVLNAVGPTFQKLRLPLDRYRFAIQKMAKPFRESLLEAYQSKDPESMKRRIDSFVAVIRSRAEKGIRNTDPAVSRNFGYFGDQAVEIDFGNYSHSCVSKDWEVARYSHKLRSWLSENAPEWVPYLDSVTAL